MPIHADSTWIGMRTDPTLNYRVVKNKYSGGIALASVGLMIWLKPNLKKLTPANCA